MEQDWVYGLIGGTLLGASAVFLRLTVGAPLGISGFLSKALSLRPAVAGWRLAFLAGMLLTALVVAQVYPVAVGESLGRETWQIVLAAILVGGGARVAGGCTSGHSLCGMGSMDIDSFVATVLFIFSGAAVVYLFTGGILS